MISFAPYRPAPETRESYTDEQVNVAVAAAKGTAASELTATVEAIARLWESAFASGVSDRLKPWQLAMIGRQLVLLGESVWFIGRGEILPTADHDVRGRSADPRRWTYRLSLPAPDTTLQRSSVGADRVLHARIGAVRARPWRGCSPLTNAGATKGVLEQIERSLSEEHSGPVGHVIPVTDPENQQSTADEIGALKGRAILTEQSELDLPGEGPGGRSTWKPNRVGPQPASSTQAIRQDVERSLLAAAGVPSELTQPTSGSDAREAWRRFLWSSIAPAAAVVSAELTRLGLPSEIDFAALNASDLAGRARAYGQLVTNGVDEADARRLTGLE